MRGAVGRRVRSRHLEQISDATGAAGVLIGPRAKALAADLAPADFAAPAAQLEAQLDALIDIRRQLTDADNLRFAKRLCKHRPHLLRFLYVNGLDTTNNQAEPRSVLRPAVITRKTGGCNRTDGGAQTHSILASVLTTCRQQGFSIWDALVKIQRNVGCTLKALAPPLLDTS